MIRKWTCAALGCAALAVTLAVAQDKQDKAKPGAAGDHAADMEVMMKMTQPNENHKLLEGMVGEWTYVSRFWWDESQEPSVSQGVTRAKMVLGGRYVQSESSGKMQFPGPDGKLQDMEFSGIATTGYDNAKQKFVNTWIDNMGTGIMASTGTYDPATRTFTYHGEYEPAPGMVNKVREVIKVIDKDKHTLTMYEMRAGKEVKVLEIEYTRKK